MCRWMRKKIAMPTHTTASVLRIKIMNNRVIDTTDKDIRSVEAEISTM